MEERGQAVVEFALGLVILLTLTLGVVDAGRGFFQYNALAGLARFGARWGAVVGGSCALPYAQSTNDFCDQLGSQTGNFWSQPGNQPIQGAGVSCPSFTSNPADYYSVSSYVGPNETTIMGAIAQRFDSTSQSPGLDENPVAPGFNLSQLMGCIALTSPSTVPRPGDSVAVTLYYPFSPVAPILSANIFPFTASSSYEVE